MKQEIEGYETRTSPHGSCLGCAFDDYGDGCGDHACCPVERSDNRHVIFVKVNRQVTPTSIYVIGSLRNEQVPKIAQELRDCGHDVFDDWYSAGRDADDWWRAYEKARGRTYEEALQGAAAKNVYAFDKRHLDAADAVVMVMPAGRSAHLELGYCAGKGKRTAILLEPEYERWDVMLQFADLVTTDIEKVKEWLSATV